MESSEIVIAVKMRRPREWLNGWDNLISLLPPGMGCTFHQSA
jgi:hypothetical protein